MSKIKAIQPLRIRDGSLYRATQKQAALLAELGYTDDPKLLSMDDASAKIDELIASKPATQKQLDIIVKLGGVTADGMTAKFASELIEQLIAAIDIDRIKRDIRIEDLIAKSYTVVKSGKLLATEEHDSLKIWPSTYGDSQKANSWTWYSQGGDGGKHLGGSVIDWVMHVNGWGRGEAISELWAMVNGRGGYVAPAPRPVVEKKDSDITPYSWQSEQWQRSASKLLVIVQRRLLSGNDGQAGRDYLAQRGISLETAAAFGLGYGDYWNITAGKMMPALWVPWVVDGDFSYIALRFLGVAKGDKTATRIASAGFKLSDDADGKYYGVRFLFGMQHLGAHGDTLILVEGEANAMSIYQVKGNYACDVLSFGPQHNLQNEHVVKMAQEIARRYQRVIVWADKPDATIAALGSIPHAYPVRSPEIDGKEHDANDLLRIGLLPDVLAALLADVGTGEVVAPIAKDSFQLDFTLTEVEELPVEVMAPSAGAPVAKDSIFMDSFEKLTNDERSKTFEADDDEPVEPGATDLEIIAMAPERMRTVDPNTFLGKTIGPKQFDILAARGRVEGFGIQCEPLSDAHLCNWKLIKVWDLAKGYDSVFTCEVDPLPAEGTPVGEG